MVVSVLPGGLPVSQSGHAAAEPSQARAATRRVEDRREQRSALTARTVWHPENNRQAPSSLSILGSDVRFASYSARPGPRPAGPPTAVQKSFPRFLSAAKPPRNGFAGKFSRADWRRRSRCDLARRTALCSGFRGYRCQGVGCDRRSWGFLGGRFFKHMRKRPPAHAGDQGAGTRPRSRAQQPPRETCNGRRADSKEGFTNARGR